MSVRVMTLVWALELPDSEKIVLLALADCANDEGHCWPGMKSLVAKCTKSDRTIQAAIQSLVNKGHLTRREVPGKGCNYTVHPRSNFTPEVTSPPKGTTQTPEAASGKPSLTVNTEAKASYVVGWELWNELSKTSRIPSIRVFGNSRKRLWKAREKEYGQDALLQGIRNIHASEFCRGGKGARRPADIKLLLQAETCPRVIEGYYSDDPKAARYEPSAVERIANLERVIPLYERDGRTDLLVPARRLLAELRAELDGTASDAAGVVAVFAAQRSVGAAR